MQGFFFDDADSFPVDTVYREQLLHLFKSKGLIEKRKVLLQQNPALEKMMVNSMGKCDSIRNSSFICSNRRDLLKSAKSCFSKIPPWKK